MKRTPAPFLIVTLLLITAHRLPAPISEIPTPTPAQSVKPKSKPVYNFNKKSSVAKQAATIADQQVQVVLSENTRVSLMHLRTYVETGEKIPFAPKSDVKPDEILERQKYCFDCRNF